ncbi:MAG: metallophosphoesterase [Candidatus Peribacteria bacterium]|nr:metallophosphoesterase [Candidatus Peribacteria bacterium]
MSLLLTAALYYIITRRITLFNGTLSNKLFLLLISFLIALMILGTLTSQFSDQKVFAILSSIGSRLLMIVLIMTILMAIEQLFSFLLSFTPLKLPQCTRRGGITAIVMFFLFAYGVHQALTTTLTETTLTTDKIPHDLTIMLVADFHVDDLISTLHLQELKKQIELQKPDLVLMAGDFFNRANVRQATYYEALSGISVPMYAVEGNHDTMGNLLALRHIEERTPIKFLYNESLLLPDWSLQLIGIEEAGQWRNIGLNEVLEASNIQTGDTFNILMTHQPISLKKLVNFPIDLEVAGHTHRGQIRGLSYLVAVVNDYGYGKYEENGRTAFITQGI